MVSANDSQHRYSLVLLVAAGTICRLIRGKYGSHVVMVACLDKRFESLRALGVCKLDGQIQPNSSVMLWHISIVSIA